LVRRFLGTESWIKEVGRSPLRDALSERLSLAGVEKPIILPHK
jgi:hypothetical protein